MTKTLNFKIIKIVQKHLGRKKKTIQKNKIDGKGLKKQKKILKNNKWFK